jgi:transposase-like protein
MKNKWDEKTKFQVVLEGLRGKEVAEICSQYGIHQAQY